MVICILKRLTVSFFSFNAWCFKFRPLDCWRLIPLRPSIKMDGEPDSPSHPSPKNEFGGLEKFIQCFLFSTRNVVTWISSMCWQNNKIISGQRFLERISKLRSSLACFVALSPFVQVFTEFYWSLLPAIAAFLHVFWLQATSKIETKLLANIAFWVFWRNKWNEEEGRCWLQTPYRYQ